MLIDYFNKRVDRITKDICDLRANLQITQNDFEEEKGCVEKLTKMYKKHG